MGKATGREFGKAAKVETPIRGFRRKKVKLSPKPRLVFIAWLDAVGSGGSWETPEEIDVEPFPVHTVGFVIAETSEAYTVAQAVPINPKKDPQVMNYQIIPKGMVHSVTDLPYETKPTRWRDSQCDDQQSKKSGPKPKS